MSPSVGRRLQRTQMGEIAATVAKAILLSGRLCQKKAPTPLLVGAYRVIKCATVKPGRLFLLP